MLQERPTARGEAEGLLTTGYRLPELKKGQTLMSVVDVPLGRRCGAQIDPPAPRLRRGKPGTVSPLKRDYGEASGGRVSERKRSAESDEDSDGGVLPYGNVAVAPRIA